MSEGLSACIWQASKGHEKLLQDFFASTEKNRIEQSVMSSPLKKGWPLNISLFPEIMWLSSIFQ